MDGLKTCEERCGTWDSVREPSPISVAGSTTSIIFCCDKRVIVVTKYVFSRDRSMLVATNIFFVFYCDKHNFFVTNVLSRQAYFCRYKHVFVATKRLSRQKRYLWQVPPMIVPVLPPGCFVLLFCNVGHDMTHYHLSVQLRSVTFIPREAFASYWLIKKTNSFTTTILYSVTRHLCVEMKNGIACHVSVEQGGMCRSKQRATLWNVHVLPFYHYYTAADKWRIQLKSVLWNRRRETMSCLMRSDLHKIKGKHH